ncbi:unnamed protein product [Rhizoctonia solani]|uniref:F-box domain-containing protein n=1 Tax=Rhizoctonia solani TaxID=456999 RepID=A0A8H3B129_9AGAM|nr:unnamed protein product [Rhizoctonia solani]
MNMFTLTDLSSEIVIQILHNCEYPAILRFAATCKTYHAIVTQSTSLQLHIELEANGLELVKDSFKRHATYSVILEDLRRFRDGWLDLDIERPIARSLGSSEMLLWELREGFYIAAFSQSEGHLADALRFTPLDSETSDPPLLLFNFTFNEFTVDPGQELVAILSMDPALLVFLFPSNYRAHGLDRSTTCHVHICSMATGLAHPLAQCPRLTVEFDFQPQSGFAVEIMGHTVLAKVSDLQANVYEILIWDWRSGILLHRISSHQGFCDFSFLDQRHLVVLTVTRSTTPDTVSLLIYEISDSISTHAAAPGKQVQVGDYLISQPILRFEFPQIQESYSVSGTTFYLRSDPTPGRVIYKNSAAFSCSYAITLSMTISFREVAYEWTTSPNYRVFIDGRYLLDRIRESRHNGTTTLPWSSWGVDATRWLIARDEPDHWICWMSGSRFIYSFSDRPYYCVFDFFSPTVGRFRARFSELYPAAFDRLAKHSELITGDELQDLQLLESHLHSFIEDSPPSSNLFVISVGSDNPTVIDTNDSVVFVEPITSRLPYRIVFRSNNENTHEGWQINGDCIVGVATWGPPSETITIYKLKK